MKKGKIFSLTFLSILLVASMAFLPVLRISAKGPIELISTYYVDETNEQRLYLIRTDSKDDITSVELAGEEITDYKFMTNLEAGEGIRTTIMVDNSVSIPKNKRGRFNSIIHTIIDGMAENELMRFATFSEDINYLTEFTTDKDILKRK